MHSVFYVAVVDNLLWPSERQFFTGQMSFLPPSQQHQITEGNGTEGNEVT